MTRSPHFSKSSLLHRCRSAALVAAVLVPALALASDSEARGSTSPTALSSTPSRSSTSIAIANRSTPQGIRRVVSANNRFAFDLFSELRAPEKANIFFSPYSVSAALAMTYEGARGRTATEMESVSHFPKLRVLEPNFAAIHRGLNQASGSYKLKTGNALWVQKKFPLLKKYVKSINKYYGGKAANLDFVGNAERSKRIINNYIAKQTANRITNLIPSGALDATTRLVLTNAIYFKGDWQWQFDPSNTTEQDFKVTPDDIVEVPMMYMGRSTDAEFKYADTGTLQILELPYKGDRISMIVLLPHDDLGSIEPALTVSALNTYISKMRPTSLDSISFPKFEISTAYQLNDALYGLGMKTAFSERADFSGMNGRRDLLIKFVFHKAYVKVNEKGTEAAAATGAVSDVTSFRPEIHFNADHPFIFVIRDTQTGNILFLGRMVNPAVAS